MEHRASSLVQSPSETFGTIFQPISHTHTSPHNRSLPNSVLNGTSTSRPERLYSASRLVNQRVNGPRVDAPQPEFTNLVKKEATIKVSNNNNNNANNEADSDGGGSENSQLSNASKLSSTSLKSAQSEFNKGAINLSARKGLSGLAQSDANRYTTVATSAANATTTTTTTLMDITTVNSHAAGILTDKIDGTMSDSALSSTNAAVAPDNPANKKRRPSMAKALVILGLSKKSNSASNLAYGKRFGFARSEEYGVTAPELRNRTVSANASGDSSGNEDKMPKPR